MAHFQREYRKKKERYDQGTQLEPNLNTPHHFPQTPNTEHYPNRSDIFSGTPSPPRKSQHIERLIEGLDKKTIQSRNLREAAKNRPAEERRSVQLNMMRLQDKQFQLKGNIFNIAVGQIIGREAYLQNLNREINQLKNKIQALQEEENEQQAMSRTIQVEERQKSAKTIDPVLERSRTIEERKSHCGRIYTRVKTPSSGRSVKFLAKQGQASSYYKWRPKVDEGNYDEKVYPVSLLENTPPRYPLTSEGRRKNGSQLQKPISAYRVKQKNLSKAAMSEIQCQTYLQNKDTPSRQQQKGPRKAKENPEKSQKKQIKEEHLERKEEPQLEPYSGIVFRQQVVPEWEISSIQQDFRAKMTMKLQIPKGFPLPAPEIGQIFQEYQKLGPKIFELFGVKLEREQKKIITRKFKNGLYYQLDSGKNVIWYYSGTFYFGDWEVDLPAESQKNGFGFQYVPNKYIYLGYFKDGMRHGKGTIKIFSNSANSPQEFMGYDGEWASGKPHGFGRHIDQKNTKYIGDFKAGQKTGKAIILNKQGLYYEGEVRKNLKHGLGFQRLTNGDTYTGMFMDGKFNGFGTYKWKNGSEYEGEFVNGKRQGKGRWRGLNGDQFEGEYFEDIKNGWGRFTWANGEIYQGEFKNDVRHGEGTYRHPGGKVGKFLWVDGQIDHRIYSKEEEEYRCRNLKEPSPQLNEVAE